MNIVSAIQLLALRNVHLDGGDDDYSLRQVLRWYSKEFHTPLHEVYELPLNFVIQQYFECKYEEMTEDERDTESQRLTETEAEKLARTSREKATNDDAFLEDAFLTATAKQEQKRLAGFREPLGEVPERQLLSQETALPSVIAPIDEPVIDVSYADSDAFDRELDGYGGMPKI